jgi:aminopeptidase N
MNKFKYMRDDFKPLPIKLEHMDINLNFIDGNVEGTNTLRITALEPLESVQLNAQELEIRSVWLMVDGEWLTDTDYDYSNDTLTIKLPKPIKADAKFSIKTETICTPSATSLDGLYQDTTPPGCPQQYMSQCQQWGFQRIMPVFDDCTAKCTMTTTIEADSAYTHLISNGNIDKETNPDGKPVPLKDNPARQSITYQNPIPMAPYLFIVAAGTWDIIEDEVKYPSGKIVRLEYLVPPGRKNGAIIPMQILKDSVIWQNKTQDYEYKHDVYRTICMEKSNFGGMENVGNTTIITSAALVDEWTNDRRIEYAHGVIIHEFEHNQCGSDVTMETPFDMWLNEGFTVDVERQFSMSVFDPDCTRLSELDSLRAPIGGPMAIEDAGHMGNIVREGFNHPDEVVDGVTYVKAPEVIRMLKLILGTETFRKAKNLYFERFNGSNANTDDFFNAFEEVSGRDLSLFKKEWLYTIGYPIITASYAYNNSNRTLEIEFKQTRSGKGGLFHVPVEIAAVDENGKDIPSTSKIIEITGDTTNVTFEDIDEPSFVSLNRDSSFYGILIDNTATKEQLVKQVRNDPNNYNRVEAMRRVTDIERIKLINNINSNISDEWIDLYSSILQDESLQPGLKAYFLRIEEQSLDRQYLPSYRERYAARIRLLKTVSEACMDDLLDTFNKTDTYAPAKSADDGLDSRRLKAVLLRTIIEADTPAAHKIAEDHLKNAWNISDKVSALSCINLSSHPERHNILDATFTEWKQHLNAYMAYLSVIGSGSNNDTFDMISTEAARPEFNIQHPGHNRSLYMPLTTNNKLLWSQQGLDWLAETIIKLTLDNENTALRMVDCLQQVEKLASDLQPLTINALKTMRDNIDPDQYPSISGRIKTYLG